nr:acyl-CoA dehydrogenase N-terminal domain-containing protein [Alphaproteobacteria bacterium]
MTYVAPLDEMRFALRRIAGLSEISALPGYEEATDDLVDAVLEEAGKLAAEVLAPLNAPGDRQRAVYENGVVRVPDGFTEAYQSFVESGWNSLPFEAEHGGQGLPWLIQTA